MMLASPKPVESADARVALREMYYSRFPRLVYPTRAYHLCRPMTAEATGVAGSGNVHVAGEAIGRQAFLLGEVLRHAEDGRVLRQPLEWHDRPEAATPQTSQEGLALWEFDNEPMAGHGCRSEELNTQIEKGHVNWEEFTAMNSAGVRDLENWPVAGEEVLETLVADEMYRQYIDDGLC